MRLETALEIDFGDPDTYARADIHEIWATLRREQAVFRCESGSMDPFWVVTSYPETLNVLSDTEAYTSEMGMLLAVPSGGDPSGGRMLVASDPPRHTALRRLFGKGLSQSLVRVVRERVGQRVSELLSDVEGREIDFVDEIAGMIPLTAICGILGVPRGDERYLYEHARVAFASEDPAVGGGREAILARGEAHAEILLYFEQQIQEKRRAPADDLLSSLAFAEIDGRPLPLEDILLNCDNVLLGGNETTRYALSGAVLSIAEQPDAWSEPYRRKELGRRSIDELLRWTSPGQHVMRVARRKTEVGMATIEPDERVTCWIPSADRDETVFANPDRLDLERDPNPHLAFGTKPHRCWGATFAKMEMAEFFQELLRRGLWPTLTGNPVRVRSTIMHGIRSLPLRFERIGKD